MSSSLFRQTRQRVRSGGQTVLIAPPSNWVAARKFSRFATRLLSLARTALLLVVLVQASTPSLAQDVEPDTQIGNFLFKMPTGWNPVEKGRALVVYAPSPPTGTVTYFALASAEMNGDLQNSFREVWRGFTNNYRILEGSATQSYQSNRRYDALYTNAIVADQNGVRWYVYVLGAQYKKRIQTVLFMTNLPPGSAFIASFGVFKHTVLASLSFGDSLPGLEVPAAEVASSTEVPHGCRRERSRESMPASAWTTAD